MSTMTTTQRIELLEKHVGDIERRVAASERRRKSASAAAAHAAQETIRLRNLADKTKAQLAEARARQAAALSNPEPF